MVPGVSLRALLAWSLALCACAAPAGPVDPGDAEEVPFGIGAKADEGLCDPLEPLCWSTADAAAMRGAMASLDALALTDDPAAAQTLLDRLDALAHKLEPGELEALDRAHAEATTADTEEARRALAASVQRGVLARPTSMYLAAHAVPLGVAADRGLGSADAWEDSPEEAPDPALTEGMRESLDMLRDSGAFGYAYAFMMERTGVLDRSYPTFDEEFPFSEPREARVERIVSRHTWATAGASVVAGAESLVPYAGVVISVAHEALMLFRIRMRMVFEIAAAYGFDVREGHNLFLATAALMSAYELGEIRGEVAGAAALPVLARVVARVGGAASVTLKLWADLARLLGRMTASLLRRGGVVARRAATLATARSAGRQVLGWATFGLAILGDVALTSSTTHRIGEHAGSILRPWGTGMLAESASAIVEPGAADCAARVLGAAAAADGVVTADERRLLAAHLSRPAYDGGAWRRLDAGSDLARRAGLAARPGATDACVRSHFRGTEPSDRLAILSWVATVHAIDGARSAREQDGFDALVESLSGSAWFGDGEELDDAWLSDLDTKIDAALIDIDCEIPPVDRLERIDQTPAAAERAVDRAFGAIP